MFRSGVLLVKHLRLSRFRQLKFLVQYKKKKRNDKKEKNRTKNFENKRDLPK